MSPVSRTTIAELLAARERRLVRLGPEETARALDSGALPVDVRYVAQRARAGIVPGSSWHPRNVLEWRLDPSSEAADPALAHLDAHVVLMCDEGYRVIAGGRDPPGSRVRPRDRSGRAASRHGGRQACRSSPDGAGRC